MSRWAGKIVVITGASSGIGLATSRKLVKNGLTVIGLARRKEKMDEEMKQAQGPGKFYSVKCDVTNEEEIIKTFQWIKENVGVVQILINNAGIVRMGTLMDTPKELLASVFDVNVMGLLDCTRSAVTMMQKADVEGYVININSIAGHQVPNTLQIPINVYSSSKFAVTALSTTLHHELRGGKIRVTSISPGYVDTDIMNEAGLGNKIDISKTPCLKADDIASAIEYVIETPPHVEVAELTIKPFGEP